MTHSTLIKTFYEGFVAGNAQQMTDCYHDTIVFSDPAFGTLKGGRAKAMWHMLIARGKGAMKISYEITDVNETSGQVRWTARYPYGPKKRPVLNHVTANFKFADGKIIEHHDTFDLYQWSKQAMGLPGYLLGWSGFMRSKIQEKTNGLLDNYMAKE